MSEEIVTRKMVLNAVHNFVKAYDEVLPDETLEEAFDFESHPMYDPGLEQVAWTRPSYKQTLRYIQQAHKNFKRRGLNLKDAPFYHELKRLQYLMEVRRYQNSLRIEVYVQYVNYCKVYTFTNPRRAIRFIELTREFKTDIAIKVWRGGDHCVTLPQAGGHHGNARRVLAQLDCNFPEECR